MSSHEIDHTYYNVKSQLPNEGRSTPGTAANI